MAKNPIKKLARQTAIYGLSSIVGRLLNYLLVPLYTRLFVPEVYGVVTELYAYVTFLLILLTYGTETGFFRFAKDKENFNRTYSGLLVSLAITSTLFVLLVYLFINPISSALQYSQNQEYIIWMTLVVAIDAFISLPFARLRQEEKAMRFAVYKLINISVNIGANLFFLLLCPYIAKTNPDSSILLIWSEQIGVGYVFISNLIANLISLIIFIPSFFRVKYNIDLKWLFKILAYSFPLLIAGFAGMINETLDRILLKHFLPTEVNIMEQIGIYGANYKLAVLMTLFIQMFRYAAEPFFFSESKNKNSKETYAKVMNFFVICGLIIFLGVMLYIDIIKHFIDVSYHSGLNIVPILLLANLFLGMYYNISIWYKLNDKTRFGAYIAIGGAIITIVLNIILIPIFGFYGSAWATIACYFSMLLASYLLGQKYYPINYPIKSIGIYFVVALAIYYISTIIPSTQQIVHFAINTVLILVFIVFVALNEGIFKRFLKHRQV